jgi:hypothetical protein
MFMAKPRDHIVKVTVKSFEIPEVFGRVGDGEARLNDVARSMRLAYAYCVSNPSDSLKD